MITFIILFVCLFLSSIVITALGTFLIVFRIISATRNNPSIEIRAPYERIQRILLESGIIYSIGMLITGIALAVDASWALRDISPTGPAELLDQIVTYSQALLTPFAVSALTHVYFNFL